MTTEHFLGLNSGTSFDAIDAGLIAADENNIELVAFRKLPFPKSLRERLRSALVHPEQLPLEEAGRLDHLLGAHFSDAAKNLVEEFPVRAIGLHGQTLLHRPEVAERFTLQIGDPHRVAVLTGCDVIFDFRRRDLALHGQAAPIAPVLHERLFAKPGETIGVANLGGIANLSVLRDGRAAGGFDMGPANCLLDEWITLQRGENYDEKGAWARAGQIVPSLLERLLAHPFVHECPPKSVDRNAFSLEWLQNQLGSEDPADVQRTLTEFSARCIVLHCERHAPDIRRLICVGGGARNEFLLERLREHMAVEVTTSAKQEIDPEAVEAMLFAELARRFVHRTKTDLRHITGSVEPSILGALAPA